MDFAFGDDERRLYECMRELGARAKEAAPSRRLEVLAEGGALGLSIGREWCGGGCNFVATAHAYEALGYTLDDAGVLLAAGAHLFGVAATIEKVGTREQKAQWLPRLADGRVLATVAATEEASGSNVAEVDGFVQSEGDGALRVCGDKRFVVSAASAGLFLFVGKNRANRGGPVPELRGGLASEPRGAGADAPRESLSCALVPRSDGVACDGPHELAGLSSAGLARVRFDVGVEGALMLGAPGAGMSVFQVAMTFERALVLAFRLGAMRRELEEGARFVKGRKLGGVPLASKQAATHRLARMKLRLETARSLTYRAAWELDRGGRAHAEAALAKWHVSEAALESSLDAMRLRGGEGYLREHGLAARIEDALGGTIHSGTSDVLADIVASWLL